MRQLVYTMFISNNRASLPFWSKENLVKHQKVSIYYENDCRLWSKKVYAGTVKNDPREVCHLKYPCNSYIFKIYQKYLLSCSETEKVKLAVFPIIYKMWLFAINKTVSKTKWHLSENIPFLNLLKNRKLLPAEKLWNILAFDKESKRELLTLRSAHSFIGNNNVYMTLWLKFLLCLNGKLFYLTNLYSDIMCFQLQ